ncbi:transposon Ty3-I Gag-Pol polyprotein [Trichonephila inaurata madagascariensis]|uniref:Transposon Ty3-I Gag-Pol polyprotein n=1 Tax=Trichonephila inaurata madagascariensis TaxID=2747483 RepID=A0A8X6XR43_9ARAC|nr:transposon Ty3-I Gag-Pol polyprotein [Trichonephila inaurata madagascariensis]
MISTWSSGSQLPPPSYYDVIGKEPCTDGFFTFIDFLPECRDPGGLISKPEYETFRPLIDRANAWLRANGRWRIVTCESVEFKARNEHINHEKMTYLEYGESYTCFVRGLRLWISEKLNDQEREQQIGYLNMLPQQYTEGGIFSTPEFESLDGVVSRFNTMIQTRPLPGRIINIESQEMKMRHSGEIDPERTCWVEGGKRQKHFLFILRIFFEISDGEPEEIGIMDFIPDAITRGGVFSYPRYEPFSNVIQKASNWCAMQNGIRICNTQSVELKMKTGLEVNPQRMSFTEHGERGTFYVRILRVAYVKTRDLSFKNQIMPMSVTQLTCKTFVPMQLTTSLFVPDFENLQETKERVTAWVKATGKPFICFEFTLI